MENNHQKVPQDPFLFLLTTINYSSADPQKKLLKKKRAKKNKEEAKYRNSIWKPHKKQKTRMVRINILKRLLH